MTSRLKLKIKGATKEEIALGEQAALAVFERRGLNFVDAFVVRRCMYCFPEIPLTAHEQLLNETRIVATAAAGSAACSDWPQHPARVTLYWHGRDTEFMERFHVLRGYK